MRLLWNRIGTLLLCAPYWWTYAIFPARDERRPLTPRPVLLVLLLALTALLFFGRIDHALLEPEEARYAEIPRQMLESGRFLTPVLHGEDYWQKPPLLYWLVMLSYELFGVHDWAARLVPCIAGVLSVAITAAWGWRVIGFWTGLVSGGILALSARYLYLAGMLTMDGLLCTCVLAALASGHLGLVEPDRRMRWHLLAAVACALGILTKGPVALVLCVVPLMAFAFLDRRSRWPTGREVLIDIVVVAAIAGPWFVMMACSTPTAAGSFFWLHNVVRYFAPFDHEKPVWFYMPSLLVGMLPWAILLVPMYFYLRRTGERAAQRRPAALGFFLLAFAWCVLFFSLSGCKRQGYILPAFPLMALMLGTFVTHGLSWRGRGHRWAQRLMLTTCAMGLTLSIAAAVGELWTWSDGMAAALLFVMVGVAAFVWPNLGSRGTSWAGCAALVFLVLCLAQRAWLPAYHERFSLRREVELSAEYEQEESLPVLSYPRRWDSISFYSRRNDVESYTGAEIDRLRRDLQAHGRSLIFVRREGSLQELQRCLPEGMTIEMREPQRNQVVVGLVCPSWIGARKAPHER